MVVPGGVFHEVAGDVTVFAPEDAALERELAPLARVFALTVAEVKATRRCSRKSFASSSRTATRRRPPRVFVTLDGSVWRWGDPNVPGDGVSEIALVPVGVQLDELPVVFEVDDDAGARRVQPRPRLSRTPGRRPARPIRRAGGGRQAYHERGFGSRR